MKLYILGIECGIDDGKPVYSVTMQTVLSSEAYIALLHSTRNHVVEVAVNDTIRGN